MAGGHRALPLRSGDPAQKENPTSGLTHQTQLHPSVACGWVAHSVCVCVCACACVCVCERERDIGKEREVGAKLLPFRQTQRRRPRLSSQRGQDEGL